MLILPRYSALKSRVANTRDKKSRLGQYTRREGSSISSRITLDHPLRTAFHIPRTARVLYQGRCSSHHLNGLEVDRYNIIQKFEIRLPAVNT